MFERGQAREQREERQRMVTMYATARDAAAAVAVNLGWLKHAAGWRMPSYLEPEGSQIVPAGKSGKALWDEIDLFQASLSRVN